MKKVRCTYCNSNAYCSFGDKYYCYRCNKVF